jgi:hypothetical protein
MRAPATHSLSGGHELLPRGTIGVAPARELLLDWRLDGAYEANGAIAKDTLHWPIAAPIDPRRLPEMPAGEFEVHDEPAAWGGGLSSHFGHFLVESVARLWPLVQGADLEGLPVVFRASSTPRFAADWLEGFGVRPIFLSRGQATRFKRMFVPEKAWRLGAWIAPEMRDIHLQARRGLAVPSLPRRDVLWLSRAGLRPRRIAMDEGLLEWMLGDHVTPVHLETMGLAEQVGTLESCRAVAGVIGSAFHALVLAECTPDSLYLCSSRGKEPYPAQHALLDGSAFFMRALAPATELPKARREFIAFPGGHRVLVPEALRALSETVLPGLLEDERLAAFADPERGRRHSGLSEIDAAAIEVVREPFSAGARTGLARLFEEQGHERWAEEQLGFARELAPIG